MSEPQLVSEPKRRKGAKWGKDLPSAFTPEKITWPQYLAEKACERKAGKQGVKLVPRFWQDKEGVWAKEYKTQLVFANRLLKQFPPELVLKAFVSEAGAFYTTLGSDKFVKVVRGEARKAELAAAAVSSVEPARAEVVEPSLPAFSPPFISRRSVADRLRDLEA
jgi:hypothetical protein